MIVKSVNKTAKRVCLYSLLSTLKPVGFMLPVRQLRGTHLMQGVSCIFVLPILIIMNQSAYVWVIPAYYPLVAKKHVHRCPLSNYRRVTIIAISVIRVIPQKGGNSEAFIGKTHRP